MDFYGSDCPAHRDAAKELNVEVAPVGSPGKRPRNNAPISTFIEDREHPSIYGTYLATAVVYAALYGADPTNLNYLPCELPETGKFRGRQPGKPSRNIAGNSFEALQARSMTA
jgi:hypothetical protein